MVTAAGRLARGSLLELPPEEFTATWETNVFGTWTTLRAVVPSMVAAGTGRIVTIGSVLGTVGIAGRSGYAATKGAVAALTRSVALELAGIPVGRWGTPGDVAHLAVTLLDAPADWVAGSVFHVDGGYTAA